MTNEKTTRELVYETNRDVKWICRALAQMEAQDEEFEARIRTLEGWRAEKVGEERRLSTMSAGAGGVVGGVVAVLVRVLGGGEVGIKTDFTLLSISISFFQIDWSYSTRYQKIFMNHDCSDSRCMTGGQRRIVIPDEES